MSFSPLIQSYRALHLVIPIEDVAGWKPKPVPKRELKAGDWLYDESREVMYLLIAEDACGNWRGVALYFVDKKSMSAHQIPVCLCKLIPPRSAALLIAPELALELDEAKLKISRLERELAELRKAQSGGVDLEEWEVWEEKLDNPLAFWKRGKDGVRLVWKNDANVWVRSIYQYDSFNVSTSARPVTSPTRKAEILAMGGGK